MPIYEKLIRDKIPEIIKRQGKQLTIRILDEHEYKDKLINKFYEEINELITAKNKSSVQQELSDILEVMNALCIVNNTTIEEIDRLRITKKEYRGGFEKRIYLIDVED